MKYEFEYEWEAFDDEDNSLGDKLTLLTVEVCDEPEVGYFSVEIVAWDYEELPECMEDEAIEYFTENIYEQDDYEPEYDDYYCDYYE